MGAGARPAVLAGSMLAGTAPRSSGSSGARLRVRPGTAIDQAAGLVVMAMACAARSTLEAVERMRSVSTSDRPATCPMV